MEEGGGGRASSEQLRGKKIFFKNNRHIFCCCLCEHIHTYTRYLYPDRLAGFKLYNTLPYYNIRVHLHEDSLHCNIGHVPPLTLSQRNPILTLIRTPWLSGGAEGGTEVEWLDGYSTEVTILCASHFCPGHLSSVHSFIVHREIPDSGYFILKSCWNFRSSDFKHPSLSFQFCKHCQWIKERRQKSPNNICGHVCNLLTPPPNRAAKTVFCGYQNKFFYTNIKGSRMVYRWFQFIYIDLYEAGLIEYILQNFSSKYIFFRFRTFCIFFSLKKCLRAEFWHPPPKKKPLQTCPQLLGVFFFDAFPKGGIANTNLLFEISEN